MVLVGEEPYRERRWTLLALAQYRSERQADALASIRTARRLLGNELGLDPGSEMLALESAILAQDPALAADHEARLVDDECPWKGLLAVRSGGPRQLLRPRRRRRGLPRPPPGLAAAGRDRALRVRASRHWCTPGWSRRCDAGPPGRGLHARTGRREARWPRPWRTPSDPVLVIDQFEEVFTTGSDAAAGGTGSRKLARYATTTAPVVLAVRSDHLAALADDTELARLAEHGLHLVTPCPVPALREVVEEPAHLAGLRLEPGLVELLLRDAEDEPGALPLLSHALAETWRRRDSGTAHGRRIPRGRRHPRRRRRVGRAALRRPHRARAGPSCAG